MNLGFLAADTLNMQLRTKDGEIWGGENKPLTMGPWNLNLHVTVRSDIVKDKECSFFVMATQRLWFYLMIDRKYTNLAVFDAKVVGISKENYEQFKSSTVKETILKIQPAIKGLFVYTGSGWEKIGVNKLLELK